ncbi:hypothetical protein DCAR_0418067 [Daucus carota subsp. sativus]|uniref:Uncharacterized protein n=2 Tax=Daucus carota subsp. sativus TaxID=79200 RepID=A0A165Z4Q4_DAUCS|nr:PREDICTED: VQ motif-containing protein 22-like [Daucus carota subsp. sativus]WOG98722.1 hypothetical protein DCAR_0418067 [Daucus carota subsp. sativus]
MSQTMSSPGNNWDFYQHNAPAKPVGLFSSNQVSDATTVTATHIGSASGGGGLSPEGRVAKPVRKRSRASRRTPTTLLNTDTANFRAMVQQFTGGSLAPFASGASSTSSYPIATNFSLGIGTGQQYGNPNAGMIPRPGYNILQVQQQLHQQQQQQQHQFMFSKNDNPSDDDHHAYLRGLERSSIPHMESSGGVDFRLDGVSSSVPPIIRSSSSSQNLSEDNYML